MSIVVEHVESGFLESRAMPDSGPLNDGADAWVFACRPRLSPRVELEQVGDRNG